jgi:hypothetical protein
MKTANIRYELVYNGRFGVEEKQSYIPTLEEAIRRKNKYYSESVFNCRIFRVTEDFDESGECTHIHRKEISV